MGKKLFIVRFYGLNSSGEYLFEKGRYLTDPKQAKAVMEDLTASFGKTLNGYLYPSRVSLYVHLIIRELVNGDYEYRKSAIYSCCEECETTTYKENPVFNEL